MINNIKIFFITLKNEKLRTNHMIRELRKLNLKYEIFYASKGYDLNFKELSLYSKHETFKSENRDMSLDEISSSLSHIKIYQNIIKYKYKTTLIFEDDVIINKDLIGILNNLNKFPKKWQLINFFTDAKQKTIKSNVNVFKNYKFTKFLEKANRTCAYLITYETANILLSDAFPIRKPPDALTGRFGLKDINSYGITPRVIQLKDFPTSIKHRNTFFGKYRLLSWILKNNFTIFLVKFIYFFKRIIMK
jgi:GR25 family glycosyltransferase involved in LPS biosynthesis